MERNIYQEQWLNRVPEVKYIDQSHYPFYYAFELKNVLFIALDASVVGHLSKNQYTWLKNILEEAKGKYRQRITFSHLPIWPFSVKWEKEIIGDPALETLLQQHDVSLYLSGHHHAFYLGYKEGIIHVSQACLGSGLRNYIGTSQRSRQGYTLIDIDVSNKIHNNAYETPDLTKTVDFTRLPEKIKSQYALL